MVHVNEYKIARHADTKSPSGRRFINPQEAVRRAKKANRGLKVYRREQGRWVLYWEE